MSDAKATGKPAWMKGLKKKKLKKTSGPKVSSGLDVAAQQYRREHKTGADGKSFTEMLDEKSLEYFNEVCARPFGAQAEFFLNAFWEEYKDHAEAIYDIHWRICKKVHMDSQGIHYLHEYEEGFDLDFDIGLVLFESIWRYFDDEKNADKKALYPLAVPEMKTSIKRKKELRDEVDVNFDGRVGFLEYLLYQFKASPKELMVRSSREAESNPELDAAKAALADVNARIKAYEKEKAKLTKKSEKKGVKGLSAKNQLAQIESGPLAEQLRAALITAEAKVRIVAKRTKKGGHGGHGGHGGGAGGAGGAEGSGRTEGSVWWLQREIKEKKKLYGARGHAGGKKKKGGD
jgi:hypothetical protein